MCAYVRACVRACVRVCVISLCSGLFLCTVMQYIGFVGVLFSVSLDVSA